MWPPLSGVESGLGDKLDVSDVIRTTHKAVVYRRLDPWFGRKHLNVFEKGKIVL